MAGEIADLWVVLRALEAPFVSGVRRAAMEAEAAGNRVQAGFYKFAQFGKYAAAAIIGVTAASVKMAADFQQAMELVHTQAGASQAEVVRLSKAVLDLAPTVGVGPKALADGLYHLESAGWRSSEAMDILKAAAQDAAIGMASMETVTQAVVGTLAVGLPDVKNAADAAAYLNQIVGIGDMRMEKLGAAIATGVLPSFKNAGLGMTDFGAALATLTDNVTPADEAATRLRMTVALMAAPVPRAAKALDTIGMSSTQLAEDMRKPNGLLVAVMDLKKHLEESGLTAVEQNQVIIRAFGGGRSSGAILTLIEESDRLKQKYEDLGTSASRMSKQQEAWAATQKNVHQQMRQVTASLEVMAIKLGTVLLPPLTKMLSYLASHQKVLEATAFVIGTVLVTATLAWAAALTEAAIANIAATWEILLIIAAVVAVVAVIYELVKHWNTVWAWIKRISLDVWHWLVDAWNWVWKQMSAVVGWIRKEIIDPVVKFFDDHLVKPFKAYLRLLEAEWRNAWMVVRTVLLFIKGYVEETFGHIRDQVMAVLVPVIRFLTATWNHSWQMIHQIVSWAWRTIIKPVWDQIKEGMHKIHEVLEWLGKKWDEIWTVIKIVANQAWVQIKHVWDAIYRDGIAPLHTAISWLGDRWNSIWGSITGAVSRAWDFISGIFRKIKDALNDVGGNLIAHPEQAGRDFAKMLGFAEGGPVPGPAGKPRLAIVHGGEFVLSREMLAGGGPAAGRGPNIVGPAGGQSHEFHLYLDGVELRNVNIKQAQRRRSRNGTTGYT